MRSSYIRVAAALQWRVRRRGELFQSWKGLPVRGGFLGLRSLAFAGELHFTLGPMSKPRRCVFGLDDIELLLPLRAVAVGLLQGLGPQGIRRFRIARRCVVITPRHDAAAVNRASANQDDAHDEQLRLELHIPKTREGQPEFPPGATPT